MKDVLMSNIRPRITIPLFLNNPAPPEIYTLSLHDALPILQAAYANLHTGQERDYFMQRYHDVISSFGGKTSYDADNRDRKSGSAGMPRPISYAVFCLKKKKKTHKKAHNYNTEPQQS